MLDTTTDDKIKTIYGEIGRLYDELGRLRGAAPKEEVKDYELRGGDGSTVRLSALFADKDNLVLVHNMGTSCPYCTMWADGFNGVFRHIEERAAFVVASNDDVATQQAYAAKRGWRFKMVSAGGTSLFKDMGFAAGNGSTMPGVSTFHRRAAGRIERHAHAPFGPGDKFCAVFSFFELLPGKGQ